MVGEQARGGKRGLGDKQEGPEEEGGSREIEKRRRTETREADEERRLRVAKGREVGCSKKRKREGESDVVPYESGFRKYLIFL